MATYWQCPRCGRRQISQKRKRNLVCKHCGYYSSYRSRVKKGGSK